MAGLGTRHGIGGQTRRAKPTRGKPRGNRAFLTGYSAKLRAMRSPSVATAASASSPSASTTIRVPLLADRVRRSRTLRASASLSPARIVTLLEKDDIVLTTIAAART